MSERTIFLRCRICGTKHEVPEESIGHRLECQNCHQILAEEFQFIPPARKRERPTGRQLAENTKIHAVQDLDRLSAHRFCLGILAFVLLVLIFLSLR